MTRVVVLAEPESLFLPNLLARLAVRHPIAAIVEVSAPPLAKTLRRAARSTGIRTVAATAAAEVAARVVDRVSRDRYYSLRKVARRLGIPYERVSELHSQETYDALERHRPDAVFAQVSRLVRPELLDRARFLNKHCALLPAYGGVLPVFWALLEGAEEVGVTIHEMDEDFDTGPVLQQASVRAAGQTVFGAYHALYDLAAPLLERALAGDTPRPRTGVERSYRSFPGPAELREFRRRGLRFGRAFRLHPAVALGPEHALPAPVATGAD